MAYVVVLKKSAEKELQRFPEKIHDRIVNCLVSLREKPRPFGAKKLHGREAYRVRVGDYRILYEIQDSASRVLIVTVGHRREVYRGH